MGRTLPFHYGIGPTHEAADADLDRDIVERPHLGDRPGCLGVVHAVRAWLTDEANRAVLEWASASCFIVGAVGYIAQAGGFL